jgi:hypothetical protein
VTEYRKKRESDNAAYTVEIERMGEREIDDLLRQSVVNYRRYHLRDQNNSEGSEPGEVEHMRNQAKVAWDTLIAAFENQACTEVLFQNPGISTEEIIRMVLGWKDQIRWPAGFNAGVAVLPADIAGDCVNQLDRFWSPWMWPFIKVIRYVVRSIILGITDFNPQYLS